MGPAATKGQNGAVAHTVRPLDASTWAAFAELVDRNDGVFGGCWCLGFHPERARRGPVRRTIKEDRVRTGGAHAALVLDEDGVARGWCQYGSPAELPGIKHRRAYDKDAPPRPDWRITCFFVDKEHRGRGIARLALAGALELIARAGGGLVEAVSEVTAGRVPVQCQCGTVRRVRVRPRTAGRRARVDREPGDRPGCTGGQGRR